MQVIDLSADYQARTNIHWSRERAKIQREIDALTAKGREAESWFKAELAKLRARA